MTADSVSKTHSRRRPLQRGDLAAMDESDSGSFSWALIKRFWPYVAPYKYTALWSAVLMLAYTGAMLVTPLLVKAAIDSLAQGAGLGKLSLITAALVFANLVVWQAQYWQVWTMSSVGQKALYKISSEMFTHLQRLSLSFYDRSEVGRVMSRLQSDVTVLEGILSSGLLSILGSLVSLFGIIFIMLSMNVPLALLTFAVLPVMTVIMMVWQRHAQRSFRRTRAAISLVNSTLQENISGMRVIQSMAVETRNSAEFDELNMHNRDATLQSAMVSSLILPLVEVVAAVAIAMTVLFGGMMVADGAVTIGTLAAFTLYINRFFNPIRQLSQQYSQLQRGAVAAERIFQILSVPVAVKDRTGAKEMPPVEGNVEFSQVDFGYIPGKPVLKDFNLSIPAGKTAAIVGPTGAGKSTIVGLLSRFYDIQDGSITIDEHDIRSVTQSSLRRQVGVVLQDPFLFTGTIRDNIRYGRLDATDEEIEDVSRTVGAHDIITRLPEGYETIIRERGQNLSVGQRQLISFARALLADPRILILDEATANIDTVTEMVVQEGLRQLLHGRTAIVIAHRLSTIKNADIIVVLQAGKIVEQGTHAELLELGGAYASLYAMGFRHAQEEQQEVELAS